MGDSQTTPIMLTVSSLVHPLNKFGRMGHIHSKFQGSFVIQVKNQLIHFGSYAHYIAGFGLYLSPEDFNQINDIIDIGNRVRITEDQLTFYGKKSVQSFAYKASKVDQRLHAIPFDNKLLSSLLSAYDQAIASTSRTALGLNTEDNSFQKIQTMLEQDDNQMIDWDKTIHYLIGRGRGLTPSGDDMLVGYLAVMKLFALYRAEDLSDQLLESPLSTTDVSKAYILAGAEDYFSTPIYQLYTLCKVADLNDLAQLTINLTDAITNTMRVGHTSGHDMTFGMGMGLRYVQQAHAKVSK